MVSNGEFIEFVKDAGYARQELWSENGWRWKMFRNVKHPQFWIPEVNGWVANPRGVARIPSELHSLAFLGTKYSELVLLLPTVERFSSVIANIVHLVMLTSFMP